MRTRTPVHAALLLLAAAIGACTPNAARTELVDGADAYDDLQTDSSLNGQQDTGDDGVDDGPSDGTTDSQDSSPADAEDATAEDALTGDADAAEVPPNPDATDGDTSSDDTADIDPDACPVMAAMEAATAAIATPSFVRQVDLASLPTWPAGSCANLVLRVELMNCQAAVGRPFDILWWTEAHGWFTPPFVLDNTLETECDLATFIVGPSRFGWNMVDPPWEQSERRAPLLSTAPAALDRASLAGSGVEGSEISVRLATFPEVESHRYYNCESTRQVPEARCQLCNPGEVDQIALIPCRGQSYEYVLGEGVRLYGWDQVLQRRPTSFVLDGWTRSPPIEVAQGSDPGFYPPSCFWFVASNAQGFLPDVRPGLYLDMACVYDENGLFGQGVGPLCENIREDMLP